MGRLLVHLRQMAASTCDRLQLFKDIYFSPNWWHHRVLQLCIIGKEAPLMYWSPCCVTRGFKKNHSHSLTAWKNNGVCGPDCHSHLLSPPASVWDSKSQWGQLAGWMTVDVYLHTCVKVSEFVCVCLSLCVILKGQSSICGSQRATLFPSQQEGGHCPYAVFTHTNTCRFTHLEKKNRAEIGTVTRSSRYIHELLQVCRHMHEKQQDSHYTTNVQITQCKQLVHSFSSTNTHFMLVFVRR